MRPNASDNSGMAPKSHQPLLRGGGRSPRWLSDPMKGYGTKQQIRMKMEENIDRRYRTQLRFNGLWVLVLSSWFLVLGSLFLVLGYRFLDLGSWFSAPGSWFLVLGSWLLVLGS